MARKHPLVGTNPNEAHKNSLSFSEHIGLMITTAVGTMVCAFVFTIVALVGLPSAISQGGVLPLVQWTAQTFLQLVLLSIIMVGQNVQSKQAETKTEIDHHTLAYLRQINGEQLDILHTLQVEAANAAIHHDNTRG